MHGEKERKEREEEWIEREDRSKEAKEKFRIRTKKIEIGKGRVNKEMGQLIKRIKKVMRVKKRRSGRKEGKDGGTGSAKGRKERRLQRILKKWKRRNGSGEDYRREYKKICERKRKEENERWMEETREAKTQK